MSVPSKFLFLCARRKFGFNKKIHRNLHTCCTWAGGTLWYVHNLLCFVFQTDGLTDRQTDRDNNFNSYVQNLRVFIFQTDRQTDGWTDRQTDGQTEKLIRCGLPSLHSSRFRVLFRVRMCIANLILAIDRNCDVLPLSLEDLLN